jgi:hypothetical protein
MNQSPGWTGGSWRRGREKVPKILSVAISESYAAATYQDDVIIAETVPGVCTRASRLKQRIAASH